MVTTVKPDTISSAFYVCCFLLLSGLCARGDGGSGTTPGSSKASAASVPVTAATGNSIATARIPFIVNRGQVDERVAFYAHTFAGTVFATRGGEIVYALPAPHRKQSAPKALGWVLRESFVGGTAQPVAGAAASTNVSMLTSSVRLPAIATTHSVRFGEVWEGVEVEVYSRGDNIEKVFTLDAGRDASGIALRIEGATLSVGEGGSLTAMTGNGPLRFAAPYAYQESRGRRLAVPVAYRLDGNTYGFELGEFDPALPVVIDPVIQSTYLGGSGWSFAQEGAREMAIHPTNGDVYIAGVTDSADLPGVSGGAVPASTNVTGFVARFSADLQTLEQATYFGGSADEWIHALLVTATDVYIAGYSAATTLPAGGTPGAQPNDPNSGVVLNGFIARLPLSLTSVTASTFLGGTSDRSTQILDATLHPNGDLYVCGVTQSATLPNTAGGFDVANASQERTAFVARVTATLDAFQQLTYFATNEARCTAIIADSNAPNEVYIGGEIDGGAAPPNVTGGVLETGSSGAYLARLNADLTQNPQSTYVSGIVSGMTTPKVFGLRQHPANGDLYVLTSGRSDAPLPANATTNGGQATCNGTFYCLLVMRLSPNLTSVVAGTFYGTAASSPIPRAFDHLAIDAVSGDVFIASDGHAGLPNTAGGFQPAPLSNGTPGIVVRIRGDLGEITQASYLSGTDPGNTASTSPISLALHPLNGDLYVAGYTSASSFPQTSGGAQPTFGGTYDGFVTRMTPDLLGAADAGTLQFSQATYSVSEGNLTAQITVNRSGGTEGAVSISYSTSNGTASAGSDYTAASGTLTWADGDAAPKTFDIDIQDDALDEGDEGVQLALTNATGGAALGSQSTATLTITDNDAPDDDTPTVQPGTQSVSAGGSYGGGAMGWWWMVALGVLWIFSRRSGFSPTKKSWAKAQPTVLLLLLPFAASAADHSAGWYIGVRGGVATSTLSEGDIERALAAHGHTVDVSVDGRHAIGELFGGHRWANGLGLQLGIVELGEYDVSLSGTTTDPAGLLADAETQLADAGRGLSAALAWSWALTERIELTPRVGAYYWESERELRSSVGSLKSEETALDATGGITLGVWLSPAWSLGIGWDVWAAGDRNDIRAWSASLMYRFTAR